MKKVLILIALVVFSGLAAIMLWITSTEPVTPVQDAVAPISSAPSIVEPVSDATRSEVKRTDPVEPVSSSPPTQPNTTPNAIIPPPPTITTIDQLLTTLLPPAERARITSIDIETDGIDGTLAFVEPIAADGSTWRLVYDQADTYNPDGSLKLTSDVLQTIVHEYAHVLMLNHTQVTHADPDASYIKCDFDQTIVDEGCAQADSYLAQFIEQFWTESDREDAYDAFLAGDEEDFAYTIFTDRPAEFVTEYAATDPVEDAAESFMFFVLQPNTVSGTTANQKVEFFGQFPELVELRKYMQAGSY